MLYVINKPSVHYLDFSKLFVVTIDTSEFALGALLSQGPMVKDLPIVYPSCGMNAAQLKHTDIKK